MKEKPKTIEEVVCARVQAKIDAIIGKGKSLHSTKKKSKGKLCYGIVKAQNIDTTVVRQCLGRVWRNSYETNRQDNG